MAHSPTPWRKIAGSIVGADNDPICHMAQVHPGVRGDERKLPALDANFIVCACNAHEELCAALKWFIDDIDGTHTVMVDFDRNVERARKALARVEAQS